MSELPLVLRWRPAIPEQTEWLVVEFRSKRVQPPVLYSPCVAIVFTNLHACTMICINTSFPHELLNIVRLMNLVLYNQSTELYHDRAFWCLGNIESKHFWNSVHLYKTLKMG